MKVVCHIFRTFKKGLSKVLIGGIVFYRRYLSSRKKYTHCRYIPTCSQYALEAIEKYGPFKGTYLALKRILRCNPLFKGGIDLVK